MIAEASLDAQRRWCAASCCLARSREPDARTASQLEDLVQRGLHEFDVVPPLGALFDLLDALEAEPTRSRPSGVGSPSLERALRRWEEAVLGPVFASPRLPAAREALASLPLDSRTHAAAVFAANLLRRAGLAELEGPTMQAVRCLAALPPEEVAAEGWAALREDAALGESLAVAYARLVARARELGDVVRTSDLFALRHHQRLGDSARRVALRQVLDTAETLEAMVPRRPRKRRDDSRSTSTSPDAGSYPVGGYAELANRGPIENLVGSELVHMDEGAELDGFDLRWAAGELLRYQRDEGIARHQAPQLAFRFAANLTRARIKPHSLGVQRTTALMALVVVVVRRLLRSDHSRRARVSLELPDELGEERDVLALSLHEYVERGAVVFRRADEAPGDESSLIELDAESATWDALPEVAAKTESLLVAVA